MPIGAIYWYGNKRPDLVKGWETNKNIGANSGYAVTWNTNDVYIKGSSSGNCGEAGIKTTNTIDLTGYTTFHARIKASVKSQSYNICGFVALGYFQGNDGTHLPLNVTTTAEGKMTGDFSKELGSYAGTKQYVSAFGYASYGSITVSAIWFE